MMMFSAPRALTVPAQATTIVWEIDIFDDYNTLYPYQANGFVQIIITAFKTSILKPAKYHAISCFLQNILNPA